MEIAFFFIIYYLTLSLTVKLSVLKTFSFFNITMSLFSLICSNTVIEYSCDR